MFRLPLLAASAVSALLIGCSSGGGGGTPAAPAPTPTPAPTPSPTPTGCTLRERQNWAATQLAEWYLFPDSLPAVPNPAAYSSVADYVDSLTATARLQGKDRQFTYVTSIAEENAYYESGSTAGLGIRLKIVGDEAWILDVFEGSPAAATKLERGSQILAIGNSPSDMRDVGEILRNGGEEALYAALGPSTPGVTRTIRYSWNVLNGAIQETETLTKANYAIEPVPSRFGVQIIDPYGNDPIGYLHLRTFISTATPQLRSAFAQFRSRGVDKVIVDLRYNGGGLVSVAELLADLLGGARTPMDVQNYTVFRASKSAYDETRRFRAESGSVAPMRVAFIVTGASASASEMVINSMTPWLKENSAIIGANTYGKPVGQIAVDRAACDDRLRIVAFATQNADRQGDYYNGLAGKTGASCAAIDDSRLPMGNPQEQSTERAIWFLRGQHQSLNCPPIEPVARAMSAGDARPAALRATTAQRENPGLF